MVGDEKEYLENWDFPGGSSFPGGTVVKKLPANARAAGDGVPYPGRKIPGLQYSCLENSMDRGPWRATAHGVAES